MYDLSFFISLAVNVSCLLSESSVFVTTVICAFMNVSSSVRPIADCVTLFQVQKLFIASMNCKRDILIVRYWFYTFCVDF